MAKSESSSKFFIGLVKPCAGILLSPEYEKHITIHGPFKLYTDVLEVDTESVVLVLAALRDNNIIKLSPQKEKQKGPEDGVVILSPVFSTKAEKQQLKITIDCEFVKRILKSPTYTARNLKVNFHALDLRNANFCYFTIDDINNIKHVATQGKKQKVNVKKDDFDFEVPGAKIDFLKNYDDEMQQKFRNNLMLSGQGPPPFYDLAGHKHFVHDDTRHAKEEKKSKQWWNRLSEAKVREVVVQASSLVQDVLTDECLPEAVSKIIEDQ